MDVFGCSKINVLDISTMLYAFLGLLAILMIVFTVFSAKTWSVLNVILVFLVFTAQVVMLFYAALVLNTTSVWKHEYEELESTCM